MFFNHCSSVLIITQMSVHCCRALRAILDESFHGPYPGPINKYYNILICAFVSVHCCRPSAREATPLQGVVLIPQQKIGTQCGAYGWWQEIQMHNNSKPACWPADGWPQSCPKSNSFLWNNTSEHTTFTQWPTGQLQQCTTPSQSAQKMGPCAQGLCPFNMGDVSGDIEAQDRFPPKSVSPEREGTPSSLSQNQATWRMRVQPAKLTEEMR